MKVLKKQNPYDYYYAMILIYESYVLILKKTIACNLYQKDLGIEENQKKESASIRPASGILAGRRPIVDNLLLGDLLVKNLSVEDLLVKNLLVEDPLLLSKNLVMKIYWS